MVLGRLFRGTHRTYGFATLTIIAVAVGIAFYAVRSSSASRVQGRIDGSGISADTLILTESPTLSVQSRAATADDAIPADISKFLVSGDGEQAIASTARLSKVADGARLFILQSSRGPNRFCALAVLNWKDGSIGELSCGLRATLNTGRFLVSVPTRPGDATVGKTYFGVVPDGLVAASRNGSALDISGNAFGLTVDGDVPFGSVEFARRDGSRVTVDQ